MEIHATKRNSAETTNQEFSLLFYVEREYEGQLKALLTRNAF